MLQCLGQIGQCRGAGRVKRISLLFAVLAGPALAECPGGADPVFFCSLGNSEDVELCLIDDEARLRMGFDVSEPLQEIIMPLALMPYRSTGIARSGEDFSYATFYKGDHALTVGLDRDLDMASVSIGVPSDLEPEVDHSCFAEGLVDNFARLDGAMMAIGRVAPVVAAQPVTGNCGPVQALGPADWHDDKDISPVHTSPNGTVTEVLFVEDLVRVCGDPVDDWHPVRFLSAGFDCALAEPDAPGAVCSSGWVHASQLMTMTTMDRPQALACQAGAFRFAMVRANNGVVTVMNEEMTLRLEPGEGPMSTTDTGETQVLRLNDALFITVDYGALTMVATHAKHGSQTGQCVAIDVNAVVEN